jgi:hypothetical protein
MTIALLDRRTIDCDVIETGTSAGASKAGKTITHSSRSRSLRNSDATARSSKRAIAADHKRAAIGRQLWTQSDRKIERVS